MSSVKKQFILIEIKFCNLEFFNLDLSNKDGVLPILHFSVPLFSLIHITAKALKIIL